MKTNFLHRTLTFCVGIIFCSFMAQSQIKYCEETMTGGSGKTITLSCYTLTEGQYQMKIEGVELMGMGGSFLHINGTEPFGLRENAEVSEDNKTILITITSTTPPKAYTPLYVLMPGEEVFDWNFSLGIDWTSDCGGPIVDPNDTEAPQNFTLQKGIVTHNSVELLMNATDNSGAIIYEIEYNGITKTVNGLSGIQKSYYVTELTPQTAYTFSVKAKDGNNNMAANNPLTIDATTTEKTSNGCEGTDTEASQGSFERGYNYSFTTVGNDVTIEFEMLDEKVGLVGYCFTMNPDFAEVQMTQIAGTNRFTTTYTGQTPGSVFRVAGKFAFAGGDAITKYFDYIVGGDCGSTSVEESFTESTAAFYPNPVQDKLFISTEDAIDEIVIYSLTGQIVKTLQTVNGKAGISIAALPAGNYLIKAILSNGTVLTRRIIKL